MTCMGWKFKQHLNNLIRCMLDENILKINCVYWRDNSLYCHGSSRKNSTYRHSPPYLLFGIKTWPGSKRFKSARGMKFYFTHAGAYFNWTDNLAVWLTWWVSWFLYWSTYPFGIIQLPPYFHSLLFLPL